VRPGEKGGHDNSCKLTGGERDGISARNVKRWNQVISLGNAGPEHAGESREGDRDRCDGARLNDGEKRPTVRNPRIGENASRRYTYMPPARGIMAASSP